MPFGPVKSFTYGNGVTDARTYDLDYRMTSITDAGTSAISSTSATATTPTTTSPSSPTTSPPPNNQTLTYDADRPADIRLGGPYGTVSSITYDSNSNRLTYGATSYTVPCGSDKMSAVGGSHHLHITGNINAIATTR